jgi:lysophospholipase L1-like esterase/Flp pilus assembly pilin Flp
VTTTRSAALRRGERGAGTLEYVGMAAVVAVVMTALFLTPLGGRFSGAISTAACRVTGGTSCGQSVGDPALSPYERALSGRYVAMGDSFSSGEGAGDYEPASDRDDRGFADWMDSHVWWPGDREPKYHNGCHRSANAYGSIIAAAEHFAGGSSFVACSGAELNELQHPNGGQSGEDAQEDALGDDTSLVTFSIGGNDMGFADILKDCVIDGSTCEQQNEATFQRLLESKKQELIDTYRRIREKAPNARIIVVGYPRLFPSDPSDNYRDLLFADDQRWMNEKADELNDMLLQAVRDSDADAEFVDPRAAFEGHGIGSADPWFNDVSVQANGFTPINPESFHPNAAGQRALAELVQEQMRHPRP